MRWKVAYAVIGLCLAIVFGLSALFWPRPDPVLVIEGQSNFVEYRVKRSHVSAIPLVEASIRGDDEMTGVTALWTPDVDAKVSYNWFDDGIVISCDGTSVLEYADGKRTPLANMVFIRIAVGQSGSVLPDLPISGPAQIGSISQVPTAPRQGRPILPSQIFLGGKIDIFAKEKLPPWKKNKSLYHVSRLELPAGGMLTSSSPVQAPNGASWYGVSRYGSKGFDVSATTETTQLKIVRSGAGEGETAGFNIGTISRAYSDPSLASLAAGIAVILSMLGFTSLIKDLMFRE